jgi:hypothetical protein
MQGSLERVRAVMSGDQPDRPPGVYRPSPRRSGDMHAVVMLDVMSPKEGGGDLPAVFTSTI